MKGFSISTAIEEYNTFADFAKENNVGPADLILTNEYIYNPVISELNLGVPTLFQEKYGLGEPTDGMINDILAELRTKTFDRIIAVGGGTIIDIAKVVAVAKPEETVDDLYDNVASLEKRHPLIIVPTTCGTGSEVTNISIINRVSRGVKMGLVSSAMYADVAAMITNMLDTLPYKVFATSSIDALVHAVESFLSPNACSISRIFSKAAMDTIVSCWAKSVDKEDQNAWKEYKGEFLRASNWAGLAFGYGGCAAVHAMAYPLGSVYHIPHGQSNQLMFADTMKKYKELQPVGKINELEEILGGILGVAPEEALDALYTLLDKVLKKEPLRNFGVKEEDLPVFAKNVIETQQRLLKNNYVPLTEEQILEVYKAAF
ncbi:MAG: iron-containing alcohol dehydrogenase [Eubacterium sp.]|nr:iron-containing alcohol dehydrogenase [Eubacterium sp.]